MNRSGKGENASYLCRMGDSCGAHLRIRVQDLEDTVLEILKKLVFVQREGELKREENRCRAISEITKIKEEKRILEMKMEHCKTSRLNLYWQWAACPDPFRSAAAYCSESALRQRRPA